MKTQRQKFEDWIDSLTFDQLHSLEERSAWIAWRAAIESVVVELPCWSEYDTPRQAIDACAERIEAAGVIVNDRP